MSSAPGTREAAAVAEVSTSDGWDSGQPPLVGLLMKAPTLERFCSCIFTVITNSADKHHAGIAFFFVLRSQIWLAEINLVGNITLFQSQERQPHQIQRFSLDVSKRKH